jgi:hypothetical protein
MKALDFNWLALVKKLRADVLHHIEQEEGEVFARARQLIDNEEAKGLARRFERLKPEVTSRSVFASGAALIANLLPLRRRQAA